MNDAENKAGVFSSKKQHMMLSYITQKRMGIIIKKSLRTALIAVCVVFIIIFAFSAYKIASTIIGYRKAAKEYTGLSNQFVVTVSPSPTPSVTPGTGEAPESTEPVKEVFPFKVDFETLRQTSKDAVGWIYSENTPINYPIVYGEDNVYYLEHLHNGDFNLNGSIFIDCREPADFSCKNTVIYGHNMNDGSMFASLRKYRDAAYYPEHPCLYIATPDKYYRVDIVAGLITESTSYIYAFDFETEEQFLAYIESAKASSTFQSDVEVDVDDQIVTLSTCTYEIDNGRYVIIGKLVECAPPEG